MNAITAMDAIAILEILCHIMIDLWVERQLRNAIIANKEVKRMTFIELIKKLAAKFSHFLEERWTKYTDLDKSIKLAARSARRGDVALDLARERQYLVSQHGKDFWELLGEELYAERTAAGRLHNRAKRLNWLQIAKDVSVLCPIAALVAIFG